MQKLWWRLAPVIIKKYFKREKEIIIYGGIKNEI